MSSTETPCSGGNNLIVLIGCMIVTFLLLLLSNEETKDKDHLAQSSTDDTEQYDSTRYVKSNNITIQLDADRIKIQMESKEIHYRQQSIRRQKRLSDHKEVEHNTDIKKIDTNTHNRIGYVTIHEDISDVPLNFMCFQLKQSFTYCINVTENHDDEVVLSLKVINNIGGQDNVKDVKLNVDKNLISKASGKSTVMFGSNGNFIKDNTQNYRYDEGNIEHFHGSRDFSRNKNDCLEGSRGTPLYQKIGKRDNRLSENWGEENKPERDCALRDTRINQKNGKRAMPDQYDFKQEFAEDDENIRNQNSNGYESEERALQPKQCVTWNYNSNYQNFNEEKNNFDYLNNQKDRAVIEKKEILDFMRNGKNRKHLKTTTDKSTTVNNKQDWKYFMTTDVAKSKPDETFASDNRELNFATEPHISNFSGPTFDSSQLVKEIQSVLLDLLVHQTDQNRSDPAEKFRNSESRDTIYEDLRKTPQKTIEEAIRKSLLQMWLQHIQYDKQTQNGFTRMSATTTAAVENLGTSPKNTNAPALQNNFDEPHRDTQGNEKSSFQSIPSHKFTAQIFEGEGDTQGNKKSTFQSIPSHKFTPQIFEGEGDTQGNEKSSFQSIPSHKFTPRIFKEEGDTQENKKTTSQSIPSYKFTPQIFEGEGDTQGNEKSTYQLIPSHKFTPQIFKEEGDTQENKKTTSQSITSYKFTPQIFEGGGDTQGNEKSTYQSISSHKFRPQKIQGEGDTQGNDKLTYQCLKFPPEIFKGEGDTQGNEKSSFQSIPIHKLRPKKIQGEGDTQGNEESTYQSIPSHKFRPQKIQGEGDTQGNEKSTSQCLKFTPQIFKGEGDTQGNEKSSFQLIPIHKFRPQKFQGEGDTQGNEKSTYQSIPSHKFRPKKNQGEGDTQESEKSTSQCLKGTPQKIQGDTTARPLIEQGVSGYFMKSNSSYFLKSRKTWETFDNVYHIKQ